MSSIGYDPFEVESNYVRDSHNLRASMCDTIKKVSENSNPSHLVMLNAIKKLRESGSFATMSDIKSKANLIPESNSSTKLLLKQKQTSGFIDRWTKLGRSSQDCIKHVQKPEKESSEISKKPSSSLATPSKSQRGPQPSRDSFHKTMHVKIKDIVGRR